MGSLLPYLLVGTGGFLGAIARALVAQWTMVAIPTRFPLGTFIINVSGSFLLGIVGGLIAQRALANPEPVRLALGVGFLGAYTTFSTFELETHVLLEDGFWIMAVVNMLGSLLVGLAAVRAGLLLTKYLAA